MIEENNTKEICFYSLNEQETLTKVTPERVLNITAEDIQKFFGDKTYGRVEKEIIRALFTFHYVTKNTLKRYLDKRLDEFKRNNYDSIINQLQQDGIVERLTYGPVNLYTLSVVGKEYILSQPKELGKRKREEPQKDTASILECASLAQWHISLLCGDDKVTDSHFTEIMQYGNYSIFTNSHVELWKNKYHYTIHSFCIPKTKKNMEEFLLSLAAHRHALSGTKTKKGYIKDIRLYVMVAENHEQIEHMAKILKGRDELKGAEYYFVLDAYTNETRGLDLLHLYSKDRKEGHLRTLEFN